MRKPFKPGWWLCCVALSGVAFFGMHAQTVPPAKTCKAGSKDAACTRPGDAPAGTDGSAKPAGAQFPFPVEDSKRGGAAPDSSVSPGAASSPGKGLPEMPTGGVPDPPASSERPIDPASSGSGSSSSSNSSSSAADDDSDVAPTAAAPGAPVKASALKDLGSRGDTSAARARLEQTRVADDLKVASFYLKDGNTQGAYLRYRDAVDHAPDDPDARFGLAEVAGKLNKRDEAVLNYRECLKLDPAGDHDKASRKALQKLRASAQ